MLGRVPCVKELCGIKYLEELRVNGAHDLQAHVRAVTIGASAVGDRATRTTSAMLCRR